MATRHTFQIGLLFIYDHFPVEAFFTDQKAGLPLCQRDIKRNTLWQKQSRTPLLAQR